MPRSLWTSKEYVQNRLSQLQGTIARTLVIIQFTDNPIIDSFVKRKITMATQLSVECILEKHTDMAERDAHLFVQELVGRSSNAGIIIQLPLPSGWDVGSMMELIRDNDVDILSQSVYNLWREGKWNGLPPVVYAVVTALGEAGISPEGLASQSVVVCGSGKLVGRPVQDWLRMQGAGYSVVDIDTSIGERTRLLGSAEVIISGTGAPHSIGSSDIQNGVVLIDCGTSSDSGVLQGDIHPDCALVARFMTRTPGGIGPLTVLGVFENLALCDRFE